MPDDVRITGAAPGSIPTIDTVVPAAAAPVVETVAAAPAVTEAPVVVAPVVEAPAAEVMPTAQPTLFELAEQRKVEKEKPAEAEKPAAEATTETPAEKAAVRRKVHAKYPNMGKAHHAGHDHAHHQPTQE
jgi:hypothetical protein